MFGQFYLGDVMLIDPTRLLTDDFFEEVLPGVADCDLESLLVELDGHLFVEHDLWVEVVIDVDYILATAVAAFFYLSDEHFLLLQVFVLHL